MHIIASESREFDVVDKLRPAWKVNGVGRVDPVVRTLNGRSPWEVLPYAVEYTKGVVRGIRGINEFPELASE